MTLKKIWDEFLRFFEDEEDPHEPVYDPVHFGAVIVISIFTLGALFWLFWTLLVFKGGLFGKLWPAFQVLFTSKTLHDFGWEGYPYAMGAFEGVFANLTAFALLCALICGLWWALKDLLPVHEKPKAE